MAVRRNRQKDTGDAGSWNAGPIGCGHRVGSLGHNTALMPRTGRLPDNALPLMLSLLLAAIIAAPVPALPVPAADTTVQSSDASVERVEFRIRNDTGSSVRIHTGRGTSTISNGSSNRYQAEVGQEFRLDSSSGALLFEVSSDMDGEVLDLSDYM